MYRSLNRVKLLAFLRFFAKFFKIHDTWERLSKIRNQRARIICQEALFFKASGLFFLMIEILILEENGVKPTLFSLCWRVDFELFLPLSPTLQAFILHF